MKRNESNKLVIIINKYKGNLGQTKEALLEKPVEIENSSRKDAKIHPHVRSAAAFFNA